MKKLLLDIYHKTLNPEIGQVVMLHRIGKNDPDRSDSVEELKVSIDWLQQYVDEHRDSHDFISLDDLHKRLHTFNCRKRPFICFTIDDGYRDNLIEGLPFFEKNNIPFAVFVTTNFIEKQYPFNWPFIIERMIKDNTSMHVAGKCYDCSSETAKNQTFWDLRTMILSWDQVGLEERFIREFDSYNKEKYWEDITMNWDEVCQLSNSPLCTIGSHCVTHCKTKYMADRDILQEFKQSKTIIEENISKDIKYISYPFGTQSDICPEVAIAAKTAGYQLGFSVNGTLRQRVNRYLIPRISLNERKSIRI